MKTKTGIKRRRLPRLWSLLPGLAVILACEGAQMPEHLLGKWESEHERYQQCFMQIEARRIAFGTGEEKASIGIIRKIARLEKDSRQIVTIEYMDLDLTKFTVKMIYSNGVGGSLWFENQPKVVWKRAAVRNAVQ